MERKCPAKGFIPAGQTSEALRGHFFPQDLQDFAAAFFSPFALPFFARVLTAAPTAFLPVAIIYVSDRSMTDPG